MARTIETKRRLLELQGFVRLTDTEVKEFDRWLRLAPAICLAWAATGLFLGSPVVVAALIPFAVAGGVWDRHPFDLIYDHGIRRITGGRPLPNYGPQRRFACLMASVMLSFVAAALYFEAAAAAYSLGIVMLLMASGNVITGFCIPSFIYKFAAGSGRGKADGPDKPGRNKKTRILNPISDNARKL